jgi:hypothetical protein
VNVATLEAVIEEIEQVIVPFVPGVGVVHDHPGGEERDVKCSGAGSTSVMVTAGASLGPEVETTMVYCCELPGGTSPGARVLVMLRSKSTADCTLAVAESFTCNASFGEETVAVAESVVPAARDASTFETTMKVAVCPEVSIPLCEQLTVPLLPTDGAVHDHPAGGLNDTKVVKAGRGRSTVAVDPSLGPLLVTVIVQVRFAPAFTGSGDPARTIP